MMSFDVAATAMAWAKGWTLTRDKAAPVSQAYGCRIDLGQPEHLERHVVVHEDAAALRALADGLRHAGTWLKVCASPANVAPALHDAWRIQEPEYLMATGLSLAVAVVPAGYRLSLSAIGPVCEVELKDANGELAARGRAAHCDGYATFDQIVTEPAHQRKGLGRIVMATLGNYSIDQGARVGVLVATEQGRALYQAIGWSLISPVTAAVIA